VGLRNTKTERFQFGNIVLQPSGQGIFRALRNITMNGARSQWAPILAGTCPAGPALHEGTEGHNMKGNYLTGKPGPLGQGASLLNPSLFPGRRGRFNFPIPLSSPDPALR
jgi:hypothetical protein